MANWKSELREADLTTCLDIRLNLLCSKAKNFSPPESPQTDISVVEDHGVPSRAVSVGAVGSSSSNARSWSSRSRGNAMSLTGWTHNVCGPLPHYTPTVINESLSRNVTLTLVRRLMKANVNERWNKF